MPPLPPYAFMERRLMTITFVDRNMRMVDNAMWQSAFEARSLTYPANSLPVMEVEGFCIIAGRGSCVIFRDVLVFSSELS
jgi:hypothetical protein